MSAAEASGGEPATDLFLYNRYVELRSVLDPEQVRMLEFHGSERIGEPFSYEIRMISRDPIRDLARVVGTRMTVGLKLKDGSSRHFNGVVAGFRFVGVDDTRRANYVADVRSWLAFLDRRENCRVFQNRTALEVVKAILSEHPAARFRDEVLSEGMRVRPLCVQWNETDLAFVSRLMEQEGIYYHFEHSSDAHEMVLVNQASTHRPCPVEDRIETHLNLERAQIHNDMIYKWQEFETLQPDRVTLDDYDYEKVAANLLAIEPVPAAASSTHEGSGLEVYHWPGDHRRIDDGRSYARIRAQEFACRRNRVWIDTNARTLVPGHTFQADDTLDRTEAGSGGARDNRYLLLGGEFSIVGETGAGRRSGEAHFLFSGTMEALSAATQYRPPPRTPRPSIAGVQTALVVGARGQDVTTDRYGCVKVHFPWDREGSRDENGSCFVRVSQSWAGRGWGGLVTPRIGQEVVVQFLNGDPDWPLVTGAVYNAANMPPCDLPADATQSTFKSRSSISPLAGYNELRFEDKAGQEEVHLHAQKDLGAEILNDMTMDVGSTARITSGVATSIESRAVPDSPLGSSIQVGSDGLITATGSVNITLKAGPAGVPMAQVLLSDLGITLMVGPAGVPLATVVISDLGIVLTGPTISLVAEDGEITMSGPPIFPL